MLEEINPQTLLKYVETWQKINIEIDTIHSLASLLALSCSTSDNRLKVESHSLAHVSQLIDQSAVRICSILDDFIGIGEARAALAGLEHSRKQASN